MSCLRFPEETNSASGSIYAEVEPQDYVSSDDGMPGNSVGPQWGAPYRRWHSCVQPGDFQLYMKRWEGPRTGCARNAMLSGHSEAEPPGDSYVYYRLSCPGIEQCNSRRFINKYRNEWSRFFQLLKWQLVP